MSEFMIVIEPGTEAWAALAQAVRTGSKISIDFRGNGAFAVKVSEFMWSPMLGRDPARPTEPPANT